MAVLDSSKRSAMTKTEKFKVLVEQKGYGSPVDVSELPEPYGHICDRLLRFYQDFFVSLNNPNLASFPTGEIYLGITGTEEENAVAFREGSDEFIAIFIATICRRFDDFVALFACPDFLPEIGNSNSESLQYNDLKSYLTRMTSSGHFQIIPKDPVRLECAKLFAWLALKRTFLHEVGHIVFGHLEDPLMDSTAVWEHPRSELSDKECRHRQILEAHADTYSAWVLAEFWNDYFDSFQNRISQIQLQPFKYFGVITAWEFRKQDLKTSVDAVKQTHPRPDVRFNHFWIRFSERLVLRLGCSDDDFQKQLISGCSAVTDFWKLLGISAPNFEEEKNNFDFVINEVLQLHSGIEQAEVNGLSQRRENRAKRIRQKAHTGTS